MNIKKLFATLAGVSLFAQTVVPFGALAATYSQELQDAYDWAYSKGVTTMSPIDNANMYGAITRSEMAKMLSVYATEVLGMTPDTTAACTFSDIDSVKGDLHDYIIESCELGIMGQGITAFRPYDTISRAEFGTALSRVLWGNQYEGGTPYYAKHLDALKAAGIMTQIANAESTKEVRGYVMLMLMRSEDNATPAMCEETDVKVVCAVEAAAGEYDKCPAACRSNADNNNEEETVVKSGDLAVKSSAATERKLIVNPGVGAVSDLDTLTFKTSEEVTLTKVVLEKYGYATGAILSGVWLEDENGNVITNKASLNKGKATLTLKKDYRVVDGTLNATIVAETIEDNDVLIAALGGTLGFKVADVVSTAKNVDLGDYKAYTYDIVAYDGAKVELSARGGEKLYNFEAGKLYEVAKFYVKAPADSAVLVRGFTLTDLAEEIDVDKYLDKVVVKVAGSEVKATTSLNKNDQLVVSLKNEAKVEANKKVEFVVEMSLTDDFDTFGGVLVYYIDEPSDISAVDAKTESRVTPLDAGYNPLECVFLGGKVKLTNVKLGALEYAINSNDVKIAEGNLTLPQAIKGTLTLSMSGEAAPAIKNVRLLVGDDEFEGTYSANDGQDGGYKFNNIEIEEGGKVKILVDIEEQENVDLQGTFVEFELTGREQFKYVDARGTTPEIDMSGSMSVSKLTLKAPKGSLTNTLKSVDDKEFRNKEVNTYVVLDGTYTAKKVDVYLNAFQVTGNTTNAYLDNLGNTKITFYLYLDGSKEPVADAVYNNGTSIAAGDFSDFLVKADESVRVVLEAEVDAKATGTGFVDFKQFTLGLAGVDESDNDVDFATRRTVNVSIANVGSVDIEVGNTTKSVLKKAAGVIAELTVKPDGASEADIDTVEFKMLATPANGEEALNWEDVKLYVGTTDVELIQPEVDNGVMTFSAEVTEKAKKEGTVVKVELVEEFVGIIELSGFKVNTASSTKTFKKQFVDALVKISDQTNDDMSTTFTFSVDKKGTDHVYDVAISTGTYASSETVDDLDFYPIMNGDEVSNNDTDEIRGDATESYYVTAIRYCVNGETCCTTPSNDPDDGYCVTIDKKEYNDFFRIGTSYARIPKQKS